jgi:ubiquinone/menaquinone biosynthesis C-methylase UbiE
LKFRWRHDADGGVVDSVEDPRMNRQAIFKALAKYYDLLYGFKDYKREAETIRELIRTYKQSPGADLLEVACGTGKHAE